MKKLAFKNIGMVGVLGLMSFFLGSCENADDIQESEDSIDSITESLVDVESRLEGEQEKLAKFKEWKEVEERYQASSTKFEAVESELKLVKEKTMEISIALKAASLDFFKYRNQYRSMVRTKAKGTLIDLSSVKGAEYKDVRISRITPLELRVLLPSGPKGVPYALLPEKHQHRFQFSDEEANAYRQAVAKLRIARAKANRVIDADKENEEAITQLTENAAAIADKKSQIASLTRRIKAKELEAGRLESLSRQWQIEENNSKRRGKKNSANSRATKASDEANKIRLAILRAKEIVLQLRFEIGQLLKVN
ncbi:MAG TPA: hypothetical protein DDW68_11815 [Verrucomicrobiales bacterium]|nr:hypothetical protein [Verrucomicrobiales bacterium]HBE97847.1 hypothetical protein [Verrucomicrobiales bacterium]